MMIRADASLEARALLSLDDVEVVKQKNIISRSFGFVRVFPFFTHGGAGSEPRNVSVQH